MKDNLVQETFRKEIIQLSFIEKLIYYRLSIFTFIVVLFCLTNGFQKISFSYINLEDIFFRLALIFLIISLISYFKQKHSLKLLKFKIAQTYSHENIINLARDKQWTVLLNQKNAIVLKTNREFQSSKYFITRSKGEIIYVFVKSGVLLIKSINDLSESFGFVIPNGENEENQKLIVKTIEPAANRR